MANIWIILLVTAVVTLFVIIFKKIRPWNKKLALFIIALVILLFTAFQVIIPVHHLVATTGEYTVVKAEEYFTYPTTNQELETSTGREISKK